MLVLPECISALTLSNYAALRPKVGLQGFHEQVAKARHDRRRRGLVLKDRDVH